MILFFVLVTSIWFWKIFLAHFLLGVLIFTSSFLLFKRSSQKLHLTFVLIVYCSLFIFQYTTTSTKPLTSLTKQEEVIQIQRIKEYPPGYIPIGSKTVWIPAAHWLEGRKETIAVRHMGQNLAEVLDPNFYFFSNHPRERVGVDEFEKFSYMLLPFFLYGVYLFIHEKKWIVLSCALIPLLLLTFIGNNNPLGPFSLLPFFVVAISYGLKKVYEKMKHVSSRVRYSSLVLFLLIYSLVLLQLISYELA